MPKWRVNILCIAGAVLGIIATTLPWYSYSSFGNTIYQSLVELIGQTYSTVPSTDMGILVISGLFLVVGALVAFLTPIGAIEQIAGLVTFSYFMSIMNASNQIGFYLTCISSAMILISVVRPIGFNWRNPVDLKRRLLTFDRIEKWKLLQKESYLLGTVILITGSFALVGGIMTLYTQNNAIIFKQDLGSVALVFALFFIPLSIIMLLFTWKYNQEWKTQIPQKSKPPRICPKCGMPKQGTICKYCWGEEKP